MKFKLTKNWVQNGILIAFSLMLGIMIISTIIKFSIINLIITIFITIIYVCLVLPTYIISYAFVTNEEVILRHGYKKYVIAIQTIQDIIIEDDLVIYYEKENEEYAMHLNILKDLEFITYVKGVKDENKKRLES